MSALAHAQEKYHHDGRPRQRENGPLRLRGASHQIPDGAPAVIVQQISRPNLKKRECHSGRNAKVE
jgi:hypothetical protein